MNDKFFKWGNFVIVAAFVIYGFLIIHLWNGKMESAGQLGDSFGVITALFTALTFFYFVYTVDLQRQQLALQKNELSKLEEQGKEQTRIQALTALISCETELLSMHNSNWQEARGENNIHYVVEQRGYMDSSISKINSYKKELNEILEKQIQLPD